MFASKVAAARALGVNQSNIWEAFRWCLLGPSPPSQRSILIKTTTTWLRDVICAQFHIAQSNTSAAGWTPTLETRPLGATGLPGTAEEKWISSETGLCDNQQISDSDGFVVGRVLRLTIRSAHRDCDRNLTNVNKISD
jgi:hypothetical protein